MTYRDSIKLREMANSWKDIKKDLESHLFVMFEHLVKVYYYHDYEGVFTRLDCVYKKRI